MGWLAEASFAVYAVFAVGGLLAFCWFVAGKTNGRLSGWALYAVVTAVPVYLVSKVTIALARVLLDRI